MNDVGSGKVVSRNYLGGQAELADGGEAGWQTFNL